MGEKREVIDYSVMSVDQLCELWDLAQCQQSQILTDELVEEFMKRSGGPAPTVHNVPRWLHWLPRLIWKQKPARSVGQGGSR